MAFTLQHVGTLLFLVGWLLQLLLGKGKLKLLFVLLFFIGAILYMVTFITPIFMALEFALWLIIAVLVILSAFMRKE
ncbi:MAG: hypothetical protein QXQ82_01030 [Candidatus Pacearchaeota archaeon]